MKQRLLNSIAIVSIAVFFTIMWSSCATEKGFVKFKNKRDSTAANYCSIWYPIVQNTTVETKYVKGKTDTVKGDPVFIYADCDSAYRAAVAESKKTGNPVVVQRVPVYIPSFTTERVDTIFKDSTIVKESTAKLALANDRILALQGKLDVQIKATEKETAEKKTWRKGALWEGGIILAYLVVIAIRIYYGWKKKIIASAL